MDALSHSLIEVGPDLPGVDALLAAHHDAMRGASPEESCHVQTGAALRKEGARIFALCETGGEVLAVGALKPIEAGQAPAELAGSGPVVELKSMHVALARRGRGLGHALLQGLLDAARADGARGACLETGTADSFASARRLYKSHRFAECPPFGSYRPDPLSLFMFRSL